MGDVIPFKSRTRDYFDLISDAEVERLALASVDEDPLVIDLIGDDATQEELWLALCLEDLIRTDRERLDSTLRL